MGEAAEQLLICLDELDAVQAHPALPSKGRRHLFSQKSMRQVTRRATLLQVYVQPPSPASQKITCLQRPYIHGNETDSQRQQPNVLNPGKRNNILSTNCRVVPVLRDLRLPQSQNRSDLLPLGALKNDQSMHEPHLVSVILMEWVNYFTSNYPHPPKYIGIISELGQLARHPWATVCCGCIWCCRFLLSDVVPGVPVCSQVLHAFCFGHVAMSLFVSLFAVYSSVCPCLFRYCHVFCVLIICLVWPLLCQCVLSAIMFRHCREHWGPTGGMRCGYVWHCRSVCVCVVGCRVVCPYVYVMLGVVIVLSVS